MKSIIEVNVRPEDFQKYFVLTAKIREPAKRAISINEEPLTETLDVYPSDTLLYAFCKCFLTMVDARLLNDEK